MDVLFERLGGLAITTLDRPKALNAVTLEMYRAMHPQLDKWRGDPSVHALLLRGNGRAFCAGGDVRRVAEGSPDYKRDMFAEEYRFISDLHRFPRPTIAFMHGITMGGGMGISVNGMFRVATETTRLAMPEIFIGSLPDVGSTRFLNSCPGRVGLWMALTGARIGPADAIYTGLATHFVREADLPELTGTLADGVAPDRFARDPGDAPLRSLQPAIDRCFSHATIEEILAALQREPGEWAREAVSAMNRASPLSLKLTLEALQRSAGSTLEQALSLEFRVVQHLLDGPDFYEGVRAVLIDKDHSPRWSFASVADVTDDVVARHFASLGSRELTF